MAYLQADRENPHLNHRILLVLGLLKHLRDTIRMVSLYSGLGAMLQARPHLLPVGRQPNLQTGLALHKESHQAEV